jgi:hypothetical protein
MTFFDTARVDALVTTAHTCHFRKAEMAVNGPSVASLRDHRDRMSRRLIYEPESGTVYGCDGRDLVRVDPASCLTEVLESHGVAHTITQAVSGSAIAVSWWGGETAAITAHDLADQGAVVASVEVSAGAVRSYGDKSIWRRFPSLFVLNRDWAPVVVAFDRSPRSVPFPTEHFQFLDDPEWGLDVIPCLDDRSLIVQGGHSGQKFVVWDTIERREIATVMTGGYPGKFNFRSRTELWDGQLDTLYRINCADWHIADARRLRNQPDGSFIEDVSFNRDASKCVVAWSKRRRTDGGLYFEPAGGAVLLFDAQRIVVEAVAHVREWLSDVVQVSERQCIARTWASPSSYLRLQLEPAAWPTFPPRPPGAQDWR